MKANFFTSAAWLRQFFFPEISLLCHPLEKTELMMLFYAAPEWSHFISALWFVFRHFSCFLCLHFRLLRRQEPFFKHEVNSLLHTDIPAHQPCVSGFISGKQPSSFNPVLVHIHILFIPVICPWQNPIRAFFYTAQCSKHALQISFTFLRIIRDSYIILSNMK